MKQGDKFVLKTDAGLGQSAVDGDLKGDMAELDMAPGTEATVESVEDGLVIVSWEDGTGNPRRTSIPENDFTTQFGGK